MKDLKKMLKHLKINWKKAIENIPQENNQPKKKRNAK